VTERPGRQLLPGDVLAVDGDPLEDGTHQLLPTLGRGLVPPGSDVAQRGDRSIGICPGDGRRTGISASSSARIRSLSATKASVVSWRRANRRALPSTSRSSCRRRSSADAGSGTARPTSRRRRVSEAAWEAVASSLESLPLGLGAARLLPAQLVATGRWLPRDAAELADQHG
jgi:hypothetical protein